MAPDTIDTILSDVTDETTVEESLIVLFDGLDAQLKAATDPAKIAAVRARIAANKAAMVAAVLANTPATTTTASSTTTSSTTGPTVIPASVSVSNGSSVQLAVDDSTTGADITSTAVYASADPTTASVSTAGLVTGNKVGTTLLTVTDASGNTTKVPVVVS
jgi:hypothetical protein